MANKPWLAEEGLSTMCPCKWRFASQNNGTICGLGWFFLAHPHRNTFLCTRKGFSSFQHFVHIKLVFHVPCVQHIMSFLRQWHGCPGSPTFMTTIMAYRARCPWPRRWPGLLFWGTRSSRSSPLRKIVSILAQFALLCHEYVVHFTGFLLCFWWLPVMLMHHVRTGL